MSLMPDRRQESSIEIPANTQRDLHDAYRAFAKAHPDMVMPPTYRTSQWEFGLRLTPEGGTFIAKAIQAALAAEAGE